MKKTLTPAQEKCLLRKVTTGAFPPRQPHTLGVLTTRGMLAIENGAYVVTPLGQTYCDEHHLDMPL